MSSHPIRRALSAFQSRQYDEGITILDAWCEEEETSDEEQALAWYLRGFLGCLFGHPDDARLSFQYAADVEQALGQKQGPRHTEELDALVDRTEGDLKALREHLMEALQTATRTAQSTQEALIRRALGALMLVFNKTSHAHAQWAKSQQKLYFLDLQAEAETVRVWLEVLRDITDEA